MTTWSDEMPPLSEEELIKRGIDPKRARKIERWTGEMSLSGYFSCQKDQADCK